MGRFHVAVVCTGHQSGCKYSCSQFKVRVEKAALSDNIANTEKPGE